MMHAGEGGARPRGQGQSTSSQHTRLSGPRLRQTAAAAGLSAAEHRHTPVPGMPEQRQQQQMRDSMSTWQTLVQPRPGIGGQPVALQIVGH